MLKPPRRPAAASLLYSYTPARLEYQLTRARAPTYWSFRSESRVTFARQFRRQAQRLACGREPRAAHSRRTRSNDAQQRRHDERDGGEAHPTARVAEKLHVQSLA